MCGTPPFLRRWTRQNTFKTSAVSGPIPSAAIGKQERALFLDPYNRDKRCQLSFTGSASVAFRSNSVLWTSLFLWASNIVPVPGLPSSPEQFRRCFPQYARTCMPGCRCRHLRLNAPVQELEDSFERYRLLFLRSTYIFFHGGVFMSFPTPTKSIRFPRPRGFNFSHSQRRCKDQEHKVQRGTWLVERRSCVPRCAVSLGGWGHGICTRSAGLPCP